MEKEKRHMIMDEGEKLIEEYDTEISEAKRKNDYVLSVAYAMAKEAILRYQLSILTLEAKNLI